MGRKGSYSLAEGRSSSTPMNVDILNDNSGQKVVFESSKGKSRRSEDPESGGRHAKKKATVLIFIAMILAIILLIAAIVWLLATRSGKALPQESEDSYGQSARKGGFATEDTTATTSTTTRRPTRIVDPGAKPVKTTTPSSSPSTTLKTTTIAGTVIEYEYEVERKFGNRQPWSEPTQNETTLNPVPDSEDVDSGSWFPSTSTEFPQTETTTNQDTLTPVIHEASSEDYGLPDEGSGMTTETFERETSVSSSSSAPETSTESDIAVVYSITESETTAGTTQLSSPVTGTVVTSTGEFTSPQTDTTGSVRDEREILTTEVDESHSTTSSFSSSSTSETRVVSERTENITSAISEYDAVTSRDGSVTHQSSSSTEPATDKDDYALSAEGSGGEGTASSSSITEATSTSRFGFAETGSTRNNEESTDEDIIFSVTSGTTTVEPPRDEICWSEECKALASQMRAVMNTNENPCENFYQYSCGKIGSKSSLFQILPIDPVQDVNRRIAQALRHIDSESPVPLQMFQTFYKQCLSGANEPLDHKIELVRNAVQEIGRFETGDDYDSSTFDITRLIGELILRHSSPVFDVILDIDKHNTSKFAFKVGPWEQHGSLLGHITYDVEHCSSLAKPSSDSDEVIMLDDLYNNYVNCLENLNRRLNRMEEALETLGFFSDLEKSTRRQLVSALRFSAESDILQPVREEKPTPAEFRQSLLAKQYTEYTVRDMHKHFPGIDWKRLFFILTKEETPEDEVVQVYFPSYLKKKLKQVTKVNFDSYKIQNVLLALYASDLFHDLAHFERHNEHGCQELAVNWMEDMASTLYLSTFTHMERKSTIDTLTGMFKDLKDTLVEQISSVSWEDPSVAATLLNKAQAVNADFANSIYLLRQPDVLEIRWKDFKLGADFVNSSLSLLKRYRHSLYILKGVDPGSVEAMWSLFSLPTVTAGRTMYKLNRILIPLGSTASGQLMNSNFPLYVNMGKIGTLMAHEIMHNFDPAGIQFFPGSSTVRSSTQYEQTFACMASKTRNPDVISVKDKHVSFQINNDLTMNERYSDAAGFALALETYKRRKDRPEFKGQTELLPYLNMTETQLFFVSTAQIFCTLKGLDESAIDIAEREHLHSELRIRELVRNSAEFREAFKCQEKASKLTDEPACPVFPFFQP